MVPAQKTLHRAYASGRGYLLNKGAHVSHGMLLAGIAPPTRESHNGFLFLADGVVYIPTVWCTAARGRPQRLTVSITPRFKKFNSNIESGCLVPAW